MTTIEDIKKRLPESLLKDNQRFAPKLSFSKRCAVLALDWLGVNRRVIARAFGVNRSTVAYICNPSSPHYRDVRKEFADLGKDAFIAKYVTDDLLTHVEGFASDPEITLSNDQVKAVREETAELPANPKADKFAGRHRVFLPAFDVSIYVDVRWLDSGPGWYVVITPDQARTFGEEIESDYFWNSDPTIEGGEAFRTSRLALDAYLKVNEAQVV